MPSPVSTATSSERLVLFTDAVAAIAITLLVLPLVDKVPEAAAGGGGLGALLHENSAQIAAFILSFAVIARLWWAHHQVFRHVEVLTTRLVVESMLWTFAIVVLPLPTATITAYPSGSGTNSFYVGTLILANGALTAIAWELWRKPGLSGERTPMTRSGVLNIGASFVSFVVALLLALFVPGVGLWGLVLNAFSGAAVAPIRRRWAREDAVRAGGGAAPAGGGAARAGGGAARAGGGGARESD